MPRCLKLGPHGSLPVFEGRAGKDPIPQNGQCCEQGPKYGAVLPVILKPHKPHLIPLEDLPGLPRRKPRQGES